jgi:hypothetical protein
MERMPDGDGNEGVVISITASLNANKTELLGFKSRLLIAFPQLLDQGEVRSHRVLLQHPFPPWGNRTNGPGRKENMHRMNIHSVRVISCTALVASNRPVCHYEMNLDKSVLEVFSVVFWAEKVTVHVVCWQWNGFMCRSHFEQYCQVSLQKIENSVT